MTFTYVELSPFDNQCMHGRGTFPDLGSAIEAATLRASRTRDWVGIEVWEGTPRNLIKCIQVLRQMRKV